MEVKGVRVEELYSLDLQCLNDLLPIYGLIFLSKLRLAENDERPVLDLQQCSPNLFFANQELNNGCATQAIISILMNCPSVEIGPQLSNLKHCSRDFPPLLKALSITNNDAIRNAHNRFAKEETESSMSQDGVYTFINYVAVNNRIYELDGLKEGPICLGGFDGASDSLDWLNVVRPILEERVEKYMERGIDFSVLGVVKDWKEEYGARLEYLERRKEQVVNELRGKMEIGSLVRILTETNSEIESVKQKMSMEDEKRKRWRRENEIRKHNYAPFLFNFVKVLSDKGKLNGLINEAKSGQKK
ncbi:ubiquitin carboxyl-terminal hydrolase 2-like [Cryptomeria japonica]|uniref:ubiquitin carboxyl-terminal hydrolase 2-like n=1 Tax=Cryptomeria japonica TaxID=3369 RepID=UPI0027DAA417|nr:ubiquitin carboxyl-terminal hydrolase 2-like [Cryptomeria japonica]